MATLSISTIFTFPLLLLFLPIKANLSSSPPLSLLSSHNSPSLSSSKHIEPSPTTNPNSPPIAADYFLPSSTTIEYRQIEDDAIDALRRNYSILAPYRTCSNCMCCLRDDSKICSMMKCCFGIVCNLPNKPYGYCSFMPLSCYCDSCN